MEYKEIDSFFDNFGTLDKKIYPDGGDSCQRVGMYYSLAGMMNHRRRGLYPRTAAEDFIKAIQLHHVAPGVLIRHPNTEWDASDWDRMSRDQLQPVVIACGYWDKAELKKLTIGHLKRAFLFCNNTRQNGASKKNHGQGNYSYDWKFPDITFFEIWANFIRSWKAWYLWPFLCGLWPAVLVAWFCGEDIWSLVKTYWYLIPLVLGFDSELLFGAIKWRCWPKSNITLNQTNSMLQGLDRLPTPSSWLASRIMPIERMADLGGEHFRDFSDTETMVFMVDMMKDALYSIRGNA